MVLLESITLFCFMNDKYSIIKHINQSLMVSNPRDHSLIFVKMIEPSLGTFLVNINLSTQYDLQWWGTYDGYQKVPLKNGNNIFYIEINEKQSKPFDIGIASENQPRGTTYILHNITITRINLVEDLEKEDDTLVPEEKLSTNDLPTSPAVVKTPDEKILIVPKAIPKAIPKALPKALPKAISKNPPSGFAVQKSPIRTNQKRPLLQQTANKVSHWNLPNLKPKLEPHPPPVKNTKNILLVADDRQWSFDNICQTIKRYYGLTYNIYIEYCHDDLDYDAKYSNVKIDLVIKFWYAYDKIDPFECFPLAKKVLCIYDYIYWNKDMVKTINSVLLKKFTHNISSADCILVSCPIVQALLQNQYSEILVGKPIYPAFDGVDTDKFYYKEYSPNKKLVVGWVGNSFNVYKRFGILRNILRGVPWVEFRVQDKTKFIPHEKMVDFYHGIDVLVCLSDAEGSPNPILEASACSRAWVSTNVGLVQLLNDVEGGEIKPGIIINKHSELVPSLEYLFHNRKIMEQMGKIGRICVEKEFSWKQRVRQFEKVF